MADNVCSRVIALKNVGRTALPGRTRRLRMVGVSTGSLPCSGPVLFSVSKLMLYLMSTRAPVFHRNSHSGSDQGLAKCIIFCLAVPKELP